MRTLLLCLIMSTMATRLTADTLNMPHELQLRVFELHKHFSLKKIQGIVYDKGDTCAGLIGFDIQDKKVAFVALRYNGNQWTPFAQVPFDQQNNYFAVVSGNGKTVALQSNGSIDVNHANTTGHHIELDPRTYTVIVRPIELGSFNRMGTVESEDWISF